MNNIQLPLLKGNCEKEKIPFTIIIGLSILILIFIIMLFSITFKRTYKLHYDEFSNLDYYVYLKDNEFFEEDYLPKDKQYISSLIDYFKADLEYSFDSQDDLALNYSYYIEASLLVDNENGKNLYRKSETLLNEKKVDNLNSNCFKIKESITFDYAKYNKIATSFINKYDLNNTSSNLVVSLYVDILGKHDEYSKEIAKKAVIQLKIPLTNDTTDIEPSYNLAKSNNEILQYKVAFINNPILFKLCVLLSILDIVSICIIVFLIKIKRNYKAKYEIKLNSILRDYKDYICETNITERREDLEKTKSLKIVSVKKFDGMIDVCDKLKKPILFHEEIVGEEAVFYIYDDMTCYIYIMNARDFK